MPERNDAAFSVTIAMVLASDPGRKPGARGAPLEPLIREQVRRVHKTWPTRNSRYAQSGRKTDYAKGAFSERGFLNRSATLCLYPEWHSTAHRALSRPWEPLTSSSRYSDHRPADSRTGRDH
jgi:hypothetical protein